MRLARPVLVLSLLAAVVASLPASARTPSLPELTGTTVVTATHSGYVDVLVPDDARLSPRYQGNPDVSFSGTGRLLGAWLEQVDGSDYLQAVREPSFLGGRTEVFGTAEPGTTCSPLGQCSTPDPTALVLHAGRYRLTVLTDGKPVRLTLRLRGLEATTSAVSPAHELTSVQRSLPAREALGDKVVTYGGSGPALTSLRAFVAASVKTSGSELDGWSLCERQDAAATAPWAFAPSCPGSSSGAYGTSAHQGAYRSFGVWFGPGLDGTAPVSLGGSFFNDGGVTLGQTLGVWLQVP